MYTHDESIPSVDTFVSVSDGEAKKVDLKTNSTFLTLEFE